MTEQPRRRWGTGGLWYVARRGYWVARFVRNGRATHRTSPDRAVCEAWLDEQNRLHGRWSNVYPLVRPPAPQRQLGAALRFSILKRDGFRCQYCGRRAPEVVLEVDHIIPATEGGSDEPENLRTACRDCNAGKGAQTA